MQNTFGCQERLTAAAHVILDARCTPGVDSPPLALTVQFPDNSPMTKSGLRKIMLDALSKLDAHGVEERSAEISRRIQQTAEWRQSACVFTFLSLRHEVDTRPIILAAWEAGKRAAVPAIVNGELSFRLLGQGFETLPTGALGLRVPDPSWPEVGPGPEDGILVVVPGLAFDKDRARLGRGKGYYDRFLLRARRDWPGRTHAFAVCFSLQIVDAVPAGPGDQKVDAIVTERGVIG
jgi:5-formyltetrahydrofolate cyclo-ligase